MKKKFISFFLTLVLLIGIVPTRAEAAQTVSATVASFKVTLNGVVMDNTYAQYPLIVYKDITYFPMTYYDCRFMAVKTDWNNDTRTLSISAEGTSEQYRPTTRNDKNPQNITASIVDYNVIINGKKIDNLSEPYPLLSFRDVTYFPMTWRFCVDEFGWEYSYTQEDGLIVDSKGSTRLRMTAEEKELASRAYWIYSNYKYYDEDGGYHLLRLALTDKDDNEFKVPAVVDIVIKNDNGEVVYSATKVVSSSDFSMCDIDGTQSLRAAIRINDSEIAAGSSGYGKVTLKVRNEGYFSFRELSHSTSSLPLTEEAHEVKMTAEEKEFARQVDSNRVQHTYHDEDGGYHLLLFALLDKNKNEIKVPAVVDIVIENDNGEVVYSATKVVGSADYSTWDIDGTQSLRAAIRINDSEISAGSSASGTIKYTVHNEGYFMFNENSFSTTTLPYNSSADSKPEEEPSAPEISAGVVVKVLDLYAKFNYEMADAAEECSYAAKNFTNSGRMALAIATAKGHIVNAISYLDQAITACGNYGEMQELKRALSEMRSKLSPMATYSLDGSLNNSTEFMLAFLKADSDISSAQDTAIAEAKRLSKLFQG